jgi:hypothetical protein
LAFGVLLIFANDNRAASDSAGIARTKQAAK